jgi:transcriptional regulator with XRE-family HTH domain
MVADDAARSHLQGLGEYIRSQRRLARMSLRDLAELTNVSNPYLSQIERGLHEPSVRVIKAIARALDLQAETLLMQAGFLDEDLRHRTGEGDGSRTEAAIRDDPGLSESQKEALLGVYRSFRAEHA